MADAAAATVAASFSFFDSDSDDSDRGDRSDTGAAPPSFCVPTAADLARIRAQTAAQLSASSASAFSSSSSSSSSTAASAMHHTAQALASTADPLARHHLWPSLPPRHLGAVRLVENDPAIGGGRGFVAARAIRVGELVLSEAPLVDWSSDVRTSLEALGVPPVAKALPSQSTSPIKTGSADPDDGNLDDDDENDAHSIALWRSACAVLAHPDRDRVLAHVAHLHPVSLDAEADGRYRHVDAADAAYFRRAFGARVRAFKRDAAAARRYRLANVSESQLLRLLAAMHCNAFSSGLYFHLAIVNHSCRPNCIKFAPSTSAAATGKHASSSSSSLSSSSSSRTDCSEIHAVAAIAAGEPITISYLTPCDQTRARRRHALRTQFRFDCNCERCGDEERGKSVSSESFQGDSVGGTSGAWQCEALLCPVCAPEALAASAAAAMTPLDTRFFNVIGGDGNGNPVGRVFAQPRLSALEGIALVRTHSGDNAPSPPSQWHCPACARVVSAAAMAACARNIESLECELDALECDIASDNFTAARALRSAMPALRTLRARLDGGMDGGGESTANTAIAVFSASASAATAATANLSAIMLHPHHVLNVRFHRLRFDAAAMALSAVRRQAAAAVPLPIGKLANHANYASVTVAPSSSATATYVSAGITASQTADIGVGSATSTGVAVSAAARTVSIELQHCALLLESALASVRLRPLILGDGAKADVVNGVDETDRMGETGGIHGGGGGDSWHCDAAKAWQDAVFALSEWRKATAKTPAVAIDTALIDECGAYAQRRFGEVSACYL